MPEVALKPKLALVYPGGRIGISVKYPYDEYEGLKDQLFPERVREREETNTWVDAALRANGIDPEALPRLPF